MPTHSSSSADVLKKMLHSARRLRYRGKHARARMKLQLALRWVDSRGVTADDEVDSDGTPEDDARGYLPYTPQELRVALADCICREADEVIGTPISTLSEALGRSFILPYVNLRQIVSRMTRLY